MSTLRLTFNAVAQRELFPPKGCRGIQINLKDGQMQFRPVDDVTGVNTVPIEVRGERGGLKLTIEGKMEPVLREALKNSHNPFYRLTKLKNGWISVAPFPGNKYPGREQPHMRIWPSRQERALQIITKNNAFSMDAPRFLQEVKAAKEILEKSHRGRPSKKVVEAQALMRMFYEVVKHVLDVDSIRESTARINTFLDDLSTPPFQVHQSSSVSQTGGVTVDLDDDDELPSITPSMVPSRRSAFIGRGFKQRRQRAFAL